MAILSQRLLGWPSEEPLTQGPIVTFATFLWMLLGLVSGLLLWTYTGPDAAVLLTSTLGGAIFGICAGASLVRQTPTGEAYGDLDDYVSW